MKPYFLVSARKNETITGMTKGSLLDLIATSGCLDKSSLILDRIIGAKFKMNKNNDITDICQCIKYFVVGFKLFILIKAKDKAIREET